MNRFGPTARLHEKVLFWRQATLLVVAGLCFALNEQFQNILWAIMALTAVGVANTVLYWLNSLGRFSRTLEAAQMSLDIAAITCLLWWSSGIESPLFVLYPAEILAGAVSLSVLGSGLAVVLSLIGYGLVAFWGPVPASAGIVLTHATTLVGVGLLTFRLIHRLRETLKFRAAATAHEIKNTVHAAEGLVSEAREMLAPGLEVRALLDDALGALMSLGDVSQRLYRGSIESPRRTIKLQTILNESLVLAGPSLRASGVQPAVDMPKHSVWLRADPEALRHSFLNLFLNAAHHGAPGEPMHVRCESGWTHAQVVVENPRNDAAAAAGTDGERGGAERAAAAPDSWGVGLKVTRDLLTGQRGRLVLEASPTGCMRASVFLRAWSLPWWNGRQPAASGSAQG